VEAGGGDDVVEAGLREHAAVEGARPGGHEAAGAGERRRRQEAEDGVEVVGGEVVEEDAQLQGRLFLALRQHGVDGVGHHEERVGPRAAAQVGDGQGGRAAQGAVQRGGHVPPGLPGDGGDEPLEVGVVGVARIALAAAVHAHDRRRRAGQKHVLHC